MGLLLPRRFDGSHAATPHGTAHCTSSATACWRGCIAASPHLGSRSLGLSGSTVPQALLGPDVDGVVISDFFSVYAPRDVKKARGWSQLLRDSHDDAKGQDAARERTHFHRPRHTRYLAMGVALALVQADHPVGRARVYDDRHTKLWRFTTEHDRTWHCQQLAERIEKYRDDLVVWLIDPAVEPTNNTAERTRRGAVVTRKTSFGSRSKRGAQRHARLLSSIMTWER